MIFEWDEAKRRRILEERRLDFASAELLFSARGRLVDDRPAIEEEDRWKTTAWIEEGYFTVVWTWRGNAMRIISMRRAHEQEIRKYRATYGG